MKKILTLSILSIISFTGVANAYKNEIKFYDEWGTQTGSAREGYSGTVNFYDQWGSQTGSAKKGYNNTTNYYDQWGTQIGSSR